MLSSRGGQVSRPQVSHPERRGNGVEGLRPRVFNGTSSQVLPKAPQITADFGGVVAVRVHARCVFARPRYRRAQRNLERIGYAPYR